MSELVPYTPNLPTGRGGQTPGFLALAGRVANLAASAAHLAEGLWNLRRQMERDANHADLLADLCTQAEVDPTAPGWSGKGPPRCATSRRPPATWRGRRPT